MKSPPKSSKRTAETLHTADRTHLGAFAAWDEAAILQCVQGLTVYGLGFKLFWFRVLPLGFHGFDRVELATVGGSFLCAFRRSSDRSIPEHPSLNMLTLFPTP